MEIKKYEKTRTELLEVAETAGELSIVQNAGAAFEAVMVVSKLRELLTDEVMKEVFMPLMNSKIGFRTDKTPEKKKGLYTTNQVRECIIDAFAFGLLPTFNQFNIIAGNMYPTKEGYTALLKKIGAKYWLTFGHDVSTKPNYAEISVKINFDYNGTKKDFSIVAVVKTDQYSSYDQLKGKAERRAKKALYEYLTGLDLGEDDGSGNDTLDVDHEEIKPESKNPKDLFNQDASK